VPPAPSPLASPLSDTEFATLAAALPASSPFNADGLVGLLHAVAVAPALIPPSAWIPIVLPRGVVGATKAAPERLLGLVLRLFNEVRGDLDRHESMIPPPEESAACESFAMGYAAGAELDPTWRDVPERWALALAMDYLGDRLDLVPKEKLAALDAKGKDALRTDMGALVATTHETFTALRRAALPHTSPATSTRVSRNGPCPCGSGKKYKRCCIDRPAPPTAR
jgi:yecA family protein